MARRWADKTLWKRCPCKGRIVVGKIQRRQRQSARLVKEESVGGRKRTSTATLRLSDEGRRKVRPSEGARGWWPVVGPVRLFGRHIPCKGRIVVGQNSTSSVPVGASGERKNCWREKENIHGGLAFVAVQQTQGSPLLEGGRDLSRQFGGLMAAELPGFFIEVVGRVAVAAQESVKS